MSALDPQEYVTDDADGRGRVQVGADRAGQRITYVVLDDAMEVDGGPQTKVVNADGRLYLGTEYAGDDDVTVGIVSVEEEWA